ncbi:MAG: NAD-dependent epimerase/dehydratase family protein, partial [Thermoanaerobaculia bacterium]
MNENSRIYIAGHRGLVGSAIVRRLERDGHTNLVTRTRAELDLLDQRAVHEFFRNERIDYVFLAAARVGGIVANSTRQADFLYENLVIATNVMHAAAEARVEKLLFLGSSCIYPKFADQPIREDSLLTGALEPTNE